MKIGVIGIGNIAQSAYFAIVWGKIALRTSSFATTNQKNQRGASKKSMVLPTV